MLDVAFAYSSNSDGFIEHDFLHVTVESNSIIYLLICRHLKVLHLVLAENLSSATRH